MDHDHEFQFLEIGHIGEYTGVLFNAKVWCSVIAGSWITQYLGLFIDKVIFDGNLLCLKIKP